MIIGIDAGHGGKDPGAIGPGGTKESEYCLALAYKVAHMLLAYRLNVGLVRSGNYDLKAIQRIARANEFNLVVSLHLNSFKDPSVWGSETLYGSKFSQSKGLAEKIELHLGALVGRSRGTKLSPSPAYPRSLFICNHLNVPSCLIECDFVSSPQRERWLLDNQTEIAKVIAQGIKASLNH